VNAPKRMVTAGLLEFLVRHVTAVKWVVCAAMAGLVVADFLLPSGYDRFPWESIGGFGAFYGFVSCVLIIVVAKALGNLLLYRGEDYYDD
jgi:hypothetical protein